MTNDLRKVPSVSAVLEECLKQPWTLEYSHDQIVRAVREELGQTREALRLGSEPDEANLLIRIQIRVQKDREPSLRRVINATGIIVHTNLGRAPLAPEAIARLTEISGYSNLEFDLEKGQRGSRDKHLEKLIGRLLPVEASLIANNNAAALLLILNGLAEGKEVIVSRGELIEIGGSFRLPEIMRKSGAVLVEVGTTNKTRTEDYANAINEKTGMILIVHLSNYQIIGFTECPSLAELVRLGREKGVPVVEDHGSGILTDLAIHGIDAEPAMAGRLEQGLDLLCFSGDKILGGPQAGIICGKNVWIDVLRKNPLFRALRVDKMTYAALEATLMLHLSGKASRVPVIRMMSEPANNLSKRGTAWIEKLRQLVPAARFTLEATECFIGGGVAPMKGLPSFAVAVTHPEHSAEEIARQLRQYDPPIVPRIEEDQLFLELRTLSDEEESAVTTALQKILNPNP